MASSTRALHSKSAGWQSRKDHVALARWMTKSDEPALAQFYNATSGLLFGLVLHSLRDTASSEEVLLRVYTDIRQEAARFDQRRNGLLVSLITLAHWHVYEHVRISKASERLPGLSGFGECRSAALQNSGINRSEDEQLVSASLASLSPTQLQMIELAYFYRMAPLEIALRLGQRLEIVKAGLQDGMSKLCRLFKNEGPAHSNQKAPIIRSLKSGH